MKIRTVEDRYELFRFLRGFGESELPDDRVETRGLYDGDRLIGCFMTQPVDYIGPFYLLPERLNGVEGGLLVRDAISKAKNEIHVVAMDAPTEAQCRRMGMTEVEGRLFIR